jgi:hypothetical protein
MPGKFTTDAWPEGARQEETTMGLDLRHTARMRARLEMQGFVGLNDRRLAESRPWLRLAPAICATWATLGTIVASPVLLWALVPFAALGALRRSHPFDALYNYGLRHLLGTRRLPAYGPPRRVACGVATVWLAATAAAFGSGAAATFTSKIADLVIATSAGDG